MKKGLSYTSINIPLSHLSHSGLLWSFTHYEFGEHPHIKRFTEGIFQCRPPQPRYNKTWDVVQHIVSMNDSNNLPLKGLTIKLAMPNHSTKGTVNTSHGHKGMVAGKEAYTFMLTINIKESKPTKSSSERIIRLKAPPTH